jgi:hypothetical protein
MANFKIKYFFPILALLLTAQVGHAQNIEKLTAKATLKDYQTAVINQLFHGKKNLMYCPEIGGTPNINVDAVVEMSQTVATETVKIIFTWQEVGHLYFDQVKLYITLTPDKKSIQDINLEYFQYGKINVGNLQEPILVDGLNLLGSCK